MYVCMYVWTILMYDCTCSCGIQCYVCCIWNSVVLLYSSIILLTALVLYIIPLNINNLSMIGFTFIKRSNLMKLPKLRSMNIYKKIFKFSSKINFRTCVVKEITDVKSLYNPIMHTVLFDIWLCVIHSIRSSNLWLWWWRCDVGVMINYTLHWYNTFKTVTANKC